MANNKVTRKREAQLNPTTRLVDKVVTMKLPVSYESTILHEYLTYSQGTMLAMFERLGGLLRMLSKDAKLTESVRVWQTLNLDICKKQLSEITTRREMLVMGMDIELPEINTPDSYKVDFIASHPIAHDMVKLIKSVNDELRENEALYMGGVIDDSDYESLKAQAVKVLSGVVDRIAKATFPGKRDGGGYSPELLAKYIRNGNRLEFADVPANVRDIISEYAQATNQAESSPDTQKVVESSPDTQKVIESSPDTQKVIESSPDTQKVVEEPKTKKAVVKKSSAKGKSETPKVEAA
jgi:hypothetical protein